MKSSCKSIPVLISAAGFGLTGFALRLILYRVGFDEQGLLPRMHPLQLMCVLLVLGAALAGIFLLKVQKFDYRPARFLNPWGRTLLAPAVSAALIAHAYRLYAASLQPSIAPAVMDSLYWARLVLALGAAAAVAAILWMNVRKPGISLFLHCVVCLFFTVDMLCRYQYWSGNPQLADYLLQVFACVCFTFCSYSRMAFWGQIHNPRLHGLAGYLGLVLGLVCAAGPDTPIFYLGGACWSAVGLWLDETGEAHFQHERQEET